MYHVSAQGVDERMINVHYYYYYYNLTHNSSCDAAGMLGMQKECDREAHSLEQKQADWTSSYCALFSTQDGSSHGF